MKQAEWLERIQAAAVEAKTWKPYFFDVANTLAGIMERRDQALLQYEKTGAVPIIKHTNKGGNTNLVKNPMLILTDELEKTALQYWRDLGLTPAGLKRINEEAMKGEKPQSLLAEVLSAME